jgi:hypothetical protein
MASVELPLAGGIAAPPQFAGSGPQIAGSARPDWSTATARGKAKDSKQTYKVAESVRGETIIQFQGLKAELSLKLQ